MATARLQHDVAVDDSGGTLTSRVCFMVYLFINSLHRAATFLPCLCTGTLLLHNKDKKSKGGEFYCGELHVEYWLVHKSCQAEIPAGVSRLCPSPSLQHQHRL